MISENIIPRIKRARGYLIYDISGKRYLDLYLDNGRAILGHRPEKISRIIKSTASKGLMASYPSVYTSRVEKQLHLLFTEAVDFRIYRNTERALTLLSVSHGKNISIDDFVDFPVSQGSYSLWRPFHSGSSEYKGSEIFIPLLPFPGDFGPTIIALSSKDKLLPPSDTLSPWVSDILVKSIASLRKTLIETEDKEWEVFDSPVWKQTGPYLGFNLDEDGYSSLFRLALEAGVLLPPESGCPGIIPLEYENSQIKSFLSMVRRKYGS